MVPGHQCYCFIIGCDLKKACSCWLQLQPHMLDLMQEMLLKRNSITICIYLLLFALYTYRMMLTYGVTYV